MKQSCRIITLLSAIWLFASGCVTEPGLDKAKFAELDRAAQDLKAAIRSGKRCEVPDTLVQRLSDGIAALKDRTASKAERDLLSANNHLLSILQDGLLLCRSRNLVPDFQFVPKGRIYVVQELDPIVEKYHLATEKHLYAPTGTYWRSIPSDSITVIWESAEAELQNIEIIEKYN